jgi:hypothetical protein
MAKDPAFLFYPNDWLGGTIGMSFEIQGAYLTLLILQFNKGEFTDQQAINVIGAGRWNDLSDKFEKNGNLFFNSRLKVESDKRKNYSESRRKNRKKETHDSSYDMTHDISYVKHMENENENRDVILIKGIDERKQDFITMVNHEIVVISESDMIALNDFIGYWTEHNPGGKKMRFEMQRVFDLRRRFGTWIKNNKNWNNEKKSSSNERIERVNEVSNLKNISEAILDNHSANNRG